MNEDVKRTLVTIGGLLVVAGALLFVVPAVNIWPFVLLFWSVGGGILISFAIGQADEVRHHREAREQR
jgi:UDP-N-acetylmuramyl pentapeptide phosphotransferase/UDP-N-acetylglucosamine-1-phosphate transferase